MDQVRVKAWGNSRGLILPKRIINLLDINIDDELNLEIVGNSIVLTKTYKHKSFEERMAEYGGKISICDYDFGEPKGKEML